MKVINTVKDLKSELSEIRKQGKKIGLVPTMGALHQGHASLVKRSVSENDATVVSVFVNPTQFNDKNDLKNYPRTLEADCKLLESLGATYVFAPSVEEIYPEPDTRSFSYPPVDTVMEGARRPGHFNGVCQIVSKLFMMVSDGCRPEVQSRNLPMPYRTRGRRTCTQQPQHSAHRRGAQDCCKHLSHSVRESGICKVSHTRGDKAVCHQHD